MKKNIDKVLINISLLYLLVPLIIFLLGWIRLPIAIVTVGVVIFSYYKVYKNIKYKSQDQAPSRKFIFTILIISFIWVYISGIGGFGYQNDDLIWRNAMFRDLVSFDWPVLYKYNTGKIGTLVYYIGFWMPSALVGKIFGWSIANYFLYLWTVFGVFLTFYLLCRYIGKFTYAAIIVMIFFSGLDIVGVFIDKWKFTLGNHIEWWATHFQYSSNTTVLFWVFNQGVPAWLMTFLVINIGKASNIGFIFAISLLFCPLPLLGAIPLAIYILVNDGISYDTNVSFKKYLKNIELKRIIKQSFTFENVASSAILIFIFGIYYFANISGSSQNNGFIFEVLPDIRKDVLFRLILLYIFEFGIYVFFIKKNFLKDILFIITIISLMLIPLYRFGIGHEFAMRGSIPFLIIFMCYIVKSLIANDYKFTFKQICLFTIFIIGSITPLSEMARYFKNGRFINDPFKTLYTRTEDEDLGFILHDLSNKRKLRLLYNAKAGKVYDIVKEKFPDKSKNKFLYKIIK